MTDYYIHRKSTHVLVWSGKFSNLIDNHWKDRSGLSSSPNNFLCEFTASLKPFEYRIFQINKNVFNVCVCVCVFTVRVILWSLDSSGMRGHISIHNN